MSSNKYLYVTFTDGTWRIPAEVIARDRAKYYADQDVPEGGAEWGKLFDEEIEHALKDEYEITDWASNNMDWDDVEGYAEFVANYRLVDHKDEWSNTDKEVKDVSD